MREAAIASAWWRELQPYDGQGAPNPRADRAALARLRRAASPAAALAEPRVIELYRRLGFAAHDLPARMPFVAATAIVLAHVRNATGEPPARRIGRHGFDDRDYLTARMKPLRFRKLLAAREVEEVAREMRRLVALAGNELDPGALAVAILDWSDPQRGEWIRTRWAYDYHAAGDAAPEAAADIADAEPQTAD